MEIKANNTHNSKIDIAEVQGDLIRGAALKLQKYLQNCLDYDRRCQLMNFKNLQDIDNLSINVLADFDFKGIKIGLFNVAPEIKAKLKSVERWHTIEKIYDEPDINMVVSLFEKDIL
ncbi:MAG: hypothetical protein ACUZ8E_11750 [Candidatus Anammoxibacter sp.]